MDLQKRSLQVSAVAIVCAIFLRLASNGTFNAVAQALTGPEAAAVILYLETGRVVRPIDVVPTETLPPEPTEPTVPPETLPEETQPVQAVFAQSDVGLVAVNSVCGYDADLQTLMQNPLNWELKSEEPTVLIIHSHATESYQKTEDYTESSRYRTLDAGYNVISVGDYLAELLEAQGIGVIHDRTLHDYPSYSASYNHARDSIAAILQENPTVQLVLDIHRDAVDDGGEQMRFAVRDGEESVAQLMLVVGTDAGGLDHPDWPQNMSLAVKLHAQLEKNTPGICRPISFRSQRFNQDLSPGGLIVEVGATGNTRQEALLGAERLARAIADLSYGASFTEDSQN